MRRVCLLLLIMFLTSSAHAQSGGYTAYSWIEGDLALAYPSGWDAPVPSTNNGVPTLQLAQALANAPDTRPPGIPTIILALTTGGSDTESVINTLGGYVSSLGMARYETAPGVLMGFDGVVAERGASVDGTLFGLGRAALLPDGRILVIVGRALAAQQETFTQTFNTVADSLVQGAESAPAMPGYGVLWQTIRTLSDGEDAFVSLTAITVASDNRLYAADSQIGVIQFDAATGAVLNIFRKDKLALPSSLAISPDGMLNVADTACQCILSLNSAGQWGDEIGGFGQDAPASIAVRPDGTLYAADQDDNGVLVRVFQGESSREVRFDETVLSPPLLSVDRAGRLLALTVDGRVLELKDDAFTPLLELNIAGTVVNSFATDLNNNLILATENQGVLVIGTDGEVSGQIGHIVVNSPLPGDFVHPQAVAVGTDGTIYVADSDDTFGSVTAMNTRVQAGRMGSSALVPGVEVQGALNALTTQQDWTLAGRAGQVVTISAVDNSGMMDVSLRLIAPDGKELAANDDQDGTDLPNATDAQIPDLQLPLDGVYTVRVILVDGSGSYSLGVSREQSFELSADGATRLSGSITAALPLERWTFLGKAGQTLTFTMQANSGTLDSVLRLLDANNNVIDENDDAADTALGKDAQLVQVSLPTDGTYTLEARRFEGVGEYTIVIVATS